MSFRMGRKGLSCVLRCWTAILLFYLCQDVYGVKVLDVNIWSSSNHTYVLQEEAAEITCEFELKNDTEHLKSVHWSIKRGESIEEFYVWKRNIRPSNALGVFKGRIDRRKMDPHKLLITSANIEMHGIIKCNVKATYGSDSKEENLVIIADACRESDWEFNLDKVTCEESVQFRCSGFFPRPIPTCGFYDRVKQRYIKSVPFDGIHTRRDNRFDLSVTRKFEAKEVIEFDDVVFLCDIIVQGADYKFRIEREMFGERGCPANYPSEELNVNTTGVIDSCWNRPANGSVITYQCDSNEPIKTIMCFDGNWIDEADDVISDQHCNGSPDLFERYFIFSILLNGALILFLW